MAFLFPSGNPLATEVPAITDFSVFFSFVCAAGFFLSSFSNASASQAAFNLPREAGRRLIILLLDQQPFCALASRPPPFDVDQYEIALQPLAFQAKLEIPFAEHLCRFPVGSRHELAF